MHVTCPAHLILLNFIIQITSGKKIYVGRDEVASSRMVFALNVMKICQMVQKLLE